MGGGHLHDARGMPFLAYLRFLQRGSLRDRHRSAGRGLSCSRSPLRRCDFRRLARCRAGTRSRRALTKSAFNIVSIVTTTGYASLDYLTWGAFAAAWFFMLTFVGGCTGSTAGGLKIFRFQLVSRVVARHVGAIDPPARRRAAPLRRPAGLRRAGRLDRGLRLSLSRADCRDRDYPRRRSGSTRTRRYRPPRRRSAMSDPASARSSARPAISPRFPTRRSSSCRSAMIMGRLEILSVLLLLMPSFYR